MQSRRRVRALLWFAGGLCVLALMAFSAWYFIRLRAQWRDEAMLHSIDAIADGGEIGENGLVTVYFRKAVSDDEFGQVTALARGRLFALGLGDTAITDAGLRHLRGEGHLTGVQLDRTRITDDGLSNLAAIPSLELLSLRETAIDGHGLASLTLLQHLQGLDLGRTRVGDDGLACVARLGHLRRLYLRDLKVSMTGLRCLSALKNLEVLDLRGTVLTERSAREIKHFLPAHCDVDYCPSP